MNKTLKTDYKDRIRGCMMGGAVGDALGHQIEFDTGVLPRQVIRFSNGRGIISDDTQMTLFTACGLLWRQTRWYLRGIAMLPSDAIYLAYIDWLGTQQKVDDHTPVSWIRNIPELNIMRNPGMTCLEALDSGKAGTLGDPINDSKGCGGIMRIAPVALYLNGDVVGDFSAKACALTHGHPLAILSAYTLGYIVCYLLADYPMEKAIKAAIQKMNEWVAEDVDKNQKLVKIKYNNEKAELTQLLNKAIKFAKSNMEDQDAISKLGGGWVAEEALAVAVYSSLKYQDSFEDAVVCAVNHDGDSDSTGAITGNMIGVHLGYDKIQSYYKDNVELKEVILELSDDMTLGVPTNDEGQISDKKWLAKYLYCDKNAEINL